MLQARIQILKPADSPAAIAAFAAAADLPRGFGGELERMPADVRAALGFDRLGARAVACRRAEALISAKHRRSAGYASVRDAIAFPDIACFRVCRSIIFSLHLRAGSGGR